MAEKILIVDDDMDTLRLVGLMLQRQGYQIVAATNGAQAIQQALTEKPDLIVLDVMMPDQDGYQVTRQLRANPLTAHIPILMFTAKSQVDDKVAGYEAGVDDYLTKPTHPVELTTHIKALLARNVKSRAVAPAAPRGYMVAVLAAKGGVGTSSLALNTGVALHQKVKGDVIVVEMRPGYGTMGLELGYTNPEGLKRLTEYRLEEITSANIEKELIKNASGVRLLLASYSPKDVECIQAADHFEAVLNQLTYMAAVVVVDFGTNMFPGIERLLEPFDEAVVVLDPLPTAVTRTKTLLEDLGTKRFGKTKPVTIVLVNRVRADVMLSWSQVQESLGIPVSVVVTPAPELAYQAALRYTPMVLLQPEGLTAQQIGKLADIVAQHAQNS
jgi:pilus assembly protein CpaE